ncbi:MAG: hypothetical protein ABI797_02375 [Chloroflexota bacterium]
MSARRQRVSWAATLRAATTDLRVMGGIRFGTAARFAALVALTLMAVVALALAAGGGRPTLLSSPSPTATVPTAAEFVRPFSYAAPQGDTQTVSRTYTIYGFVNSSQIAPAAIERIAWYQGEGPRGIAVVNADSLWTAECRGLIHGRLGLRRAPADLLEDLDLVAGLQLGEVETTTIDGRPAFAASVDPARSICTPDINFAERFSVGEDYLRSGLSARLIVLDVYGATILIDIWADTPGLATWLPTAMELVDSIHFLDQPASRGPVPTPSTPGSARLFFEYLGGYGQVFTPKQLPVGVADWAPAVEGFPFPGAGVESYAYGTVSCVDPARNCANRGLAGPNQPIDIWLVTFADSPAAEGCPMWATVDARTGSLINGDGPPC